MIGNQPENPKPRFSERVSDETASKMEEALNKAGAVIDTLYTHRESFGDAVSRRNAPPAMHWMALRRG